MDKNREDTFMMIHEDVFCIGAREELPGKYKKLQRLVNKWEQESAILIQNGDWTEEREQELYVIKMLLHDIRCLLDREPDKCVLLKY
jgi:hypothetical protein